MENDEVVPSVMSVDAAMELLDMIYPRVNIHCKIDKRIVFNVRSRTTCTEKEFIRAFLKAVINNDIVIYFKHI